MVCERAVATSQPGIITLGCELDPRHSQRQSARMSPGDVRPPPPDERAATGVTGLDDILGGGLPVDRLYLVQGTPGVGKTTLGLQFLLEGARRGESVLYITLSETQAEIR